jgi:predicted DNA-binding transcriptional regulator YafY
MRGMAPSNLTRTAGPLLSIQATAARLGVSERTVHRYLERGLLVRRKDGASGRVGVEVAGVRRIEANRIEVSA